MWTGSVYVSIVRTEFIGTLAHETSFQSTCEGAVCSVLCQAIRTPKYIRSVQERLLAKEKAI